MKAKPSAVPAIVAKNLQQLLQRQQERKKKLKWDVRLVDPMLRMFGSMKFLWANLAVFIVWLLFNTGKISVLKPFDPYPFEFLTFSVSLEAIVLSVVVLIGQNELQKDADERAELDLQINLLAEREATMNLIKLARIENHLGIKVDAAEQKLVEELTRDTDPLLIVQEIEDERLNSNKP